MNGFYVITNYQKESALNTADFIKNYLEEKHKKCYIQNSNASSHERPVKYTEASLIPKDVDCVLVLGGDGTLLHASRDLVDTGLPLLGINMGTLGYLAEIEHQNVRMALDRLIGDDFTIEDRMMIKGMAYHHNKLMMEDIALNDIVLARRGKLHVVNFNIYVDDVFLCSYRADGIIVSTPTGSTGYSLSAGGPIVSPDASLLLLTALAPHTLSSRTIVLPDNVAVTVEIASQTTTVENGADVTFDGDTSLALDYGSKVTIRKTGRKTRFIKINHTSFVEIMREKLK